MGKRAASDDVETLRRNVERALRDAVGRDEVLPMLTRLARSAKPESEAWLLAHRHLAELVAEHEPWRAALFARRVVRVDDDNDGAWAVLGLAQSLLGNYRAAAAAYQRALHLVPHNPWYAHNLGHLLDFALARPADALPWLASAHAREPKQDEISASYAHALARVGRLALAKRVLKPVIARGATADQHALWRWIDAGAPERDAAPARPPRKPARRRARATPKAQRS